MRLLANISTIGFGIQTPFLALDGTAPYTYEVQAGGAGGTINASTGLYTAPRTPGVDTILATDDLGEEATLSIGVLSPLGLLCDVIKQGLCLASDQVYIYNQRFEIPPDMRLYIAVGVGNAKPFSNVNRGSATGGGMDSEQYANFRSEHDINIMSVSEDALNRKEEVLMSFMSMYSQRSQAANNFQIAPLSTQFTNLSDLEGARIPFRFNIGVNLLYAFSKTEATEYYSTFQDPSILTNN